MSVGIWVNQLWVTLFQRRGKGGGCWRQSPPSCVLCAFLQLLLDEDPSFSDEDGINAIVLCIFSYEIRNAHVFVPIYNRFFQDGHSGLGNKEWLRFHTGGCRFRPANPVYEWRLQESNPPTTPPLLWNGMTGHLSPPSASRLFSPGQSQSDTQGGVVRFYEGHASVAPSILFFRSPPGAIQTHALYRPFRWCPRSYAPPCTW